MKATRVGARLALAGLFAAPLWTLWRVSPFRVYAPASVLGVGTDLLAALALALVALAGVFLAARPLVLLLPVATAAAMALLYPYSAVDWTRLLKDWGFTRPALPAFAAVPLAAMPVAAAFLAHALDHAERAARRYREKDAPAPEAHRVPAAAEARGGAAVGVAALALVGVGLALAALRPVAGRVPAGALAFAAPALAGGVLAAAAWWLLASRADAA